MSDGTKIEWTDATWNPIRGCVKLSPGCKHCYAATFAERFRGVPDHPYEQGFDLRFVPEKLGEPFSWSEPRRVFVNSMSDLFLDEVPERYIAEVARVMAATPWHTYQVLTKRAERMRTLLGESLVEAGALANVWWGVSVEDREHGFPRVDALRATHAKTRFLSIEPLLEDLGAIDLRGVDWVILGGESGPRARPMHVDWARNVRDRCADAGVPLFFKQWGGVQKSRTGRTLDARTHDDLPTHAFATAKIPDRATRKRLAEAMRAPNDQTFLLSMIA